MEMVSGCCLAPKGRGKSEKFGSATKMDHFSSMPDKLLFFTTWRKAADR